MESSTAMDFTRVINSKGIVGPAADWLQKALHPAGASPVAVCIPDLSRVPSVCMDFRPTTVIGPPSGLAVDALWDCLIWAPPGDVTAAVIVVGPAGSNFNEDPLLARFLQTQATGGNRSINFQKISEVPATDSFQTESYSALAAPGAALPAAFRSSYRSVTASLTASSLNNQGTVYTTQFAREFVDAHRLSNTTPSLTTNSFLVMNTCVPFDENTLNQLSPNAETWPAKDGVYMPIRLTGPSQPFRYNSVCTGHNSFIVGSGGVVTHSSTAVYTPTSIAAAGALYASYPEFWPCLPYSMTKPAIPSSTTIAAGFYPQWGTPYQTVSTSPYGAANQIGDLGYDNCAQGVTIFRGLSQLATITLQVYIGLEMIPRQDSPVRTFVKAPGAPDPRALEVYYDIANTMAVAYPAKYNSFGALLPFLVSAARNLAPYLLPVFTKVAQGFVKRVAAPVAAAAAAAPVKAKKQKSKRAKKARA